MAQKVRFFFYFIFISNQVFSQVGKEPIILVPCSALVCTAGMNYRITTVEEDTIANQTYYEILCAPAIEKQPTSGTVTYLTPSVFNLSSGMYGVKMVNESSKMFYADESMMYCFNTSTNVPIWTYAAPSGYDIVDFEFKNDTVFIVSCDNSTNSCVNVDYVNKLNGTIISQGFLNICAGSIGDYIQGRIKAADLLNNKLLLAGKFIASNNLGGIIDSNFVWMNLTNGTINPCNLQINDTVKDLEIRGNQIHLVGSFTQFGAAIRSHYAIINNSLSLLPAPATTFIGDVDQIEIYDKYLFALGKFSQINSTIVNSTPNYTIGAVNLSNNTITNFGINPPSGTNTIKYLFKIIQNKLHVSCKNIGNTYARYFLPPRMVSTSISAQATSICLPSPNNTYSISPALYATSYVWNYSGTGATLTFTNNIAKINFSTSATSGVLSVYAQSSTGGISDILSLSLIVNPRPNAVASIPTSNISCFNKKVPILSNSTTSNVGYFWIGPSGYSSNQKNDSTGYLKNGKYIVTVTNTITGCTNKDSVVVGIDTIRPIVSLPSSQVNLYCSPDSSLLNGSSSSPNPNIWWHIANNNVQHPNPYYTKNLGNYYMVVQNMTNGCKDSSVFVVGDKRILPNVKITSHTFINSISPIDTITCSKTSINVIATSDTLNTIISWKSIPGNISFTNPLSLTTQGNYKLIVNRTDNGCSDSSLIVYIAQNITLPNISITTPNASINCSSSTATLNANTSYSTTSLNWTGPSSYTSSNPAITSAQGKYYIMATNSENGCTKKDSVTVNYSPTLIVNASNDTTVCKNSSVNLIASSVGTVTGISYNWSNGSSGQTITTNVAQTTTLVVMASAINGCIGKDTVIVNIPSAIKDSIVTTKSCNGATVGSITIYVSGGIPPYKYSISNGAYTSQTTYTNLPYATYPIIIKDSIGCTRSTSASINQSSSLPQPVFIASTQNIKGDTIVLIDLTVPKADSVLWTLPANALIVGGDMFNPLVFFADTGNYVITLTAFYADCSINTTKNIHVAPVDTSVASVSNNNGIKSIVLYPNPNSGIFTATVEFYKKQNASVQVWDAVSSKYFQQNFLDAEIITLPIDVSSLSNGTYLFRVIGEYSTKTVNFVISK